MDAVISVQTALENICRTCLTESSELVDVSSELEIITSSRNITISMILMDIFEVKIDLADEYDMLPKQICESCYDAVTRTFFLRQKIQDAQKVLQEIISDHVLEATVETVADETVIDNENHCGILQEIIESDTEINEIDDNKVQNRYIAEMNLGNGNIKEEDKAPPDFMRQFVKTLEEFDHEVKNDKNKTFQCKRCPQILIRNGTKFEQHERMHEYNDKNVCHICKENFENQENLLFHLEEHKKMTVYTCQHCGSEHKSSLAYRRHLKSVHNPDSMSRRRVLCDLCGKELASELGLEIHMRQHTGEMPFHCDICDKSFIRKYSYSAHMKMHATPETMFKCEICGKLFARLLYLNKHQHVHSDYYPYQCELCERRFRDKQNYEFHIRSHNGERPYRKYELTRAPRDRRKKKVLAK